MRDFIATIYLFRTKRFMVRVDTAYESDTDLSWDDTGEVREKLESGEYVAFWVKASVMLDGHEIAYDTLGGCIYESVSAFKDHIGIKAQGENVGSYFSDMVRTAISEARKEIAKMQSVTLRAA